MAQKNDRVFQMRASDEWLRNIDDWRRTRPELPARAEAIRRLTSIGLGADPIIKDLLAYLERSGDQSDPETIATINRLRALLAP